MKKLSISTTVLMIFINIVTLLIIVDSIMTLKQLQDIDTTLAVYYVAVTSSVRFQITIITLVLFITACIDYVAYQRITAFSKRKQLEEQYLEKKIDRILSKEFKHKEVVDEVLNTHYKGSDIDIDPVFKRKIDDVIKEKSAVGANLNDIGNIDVIKHELVGEIDDIRGLKESKRRKGFGISEDIF